MLKKNKSIINRFIKGAIAGAVSSMILVTTQIPQTWTDIHSTLNALAIAGVSGAVTGLLLALQKWVSWEDEVGEIGK